MKGGTGNLCNLSGFVQVFSKKKNRTVECMQLIAPPEDVVCDLQIPAYLKLLETGGVGW